jgi:broad specificity phosphatase PhoE
VIGRILGLTPIIHPDLTERSFGIAEGWTEDQIRARYVDDTEIPGRESNTDILARVAPIIADLPAGTIVVTHHGIIRSLGVTGLIPNASIHPCKAGT